MKHSVVQTRSDEYGMSQFNTISEAFAYAWGQEDDDLAPIDKRVADLLPSYFRYLPEN
jgi:hypothetical protein